VQCSDADPTNQPIDWLIGLIFCSEVLWLPPQIELSTYKLHALKTWDMADILDGQPFQVNNDPAVLDLVLGDHVPW